MGAKFTIETDHKPLVPLLSTTHLHSLPPGVLRFQLWLDHFSYNICYVPCKNLCTAATLSRALKAEPAPNSVAFQNELEAYMHLISSSLPASNVCLQVYCDKKKEDSVCSLICSYCATEWPDVADMPSNLKPYSEVHSGLTFCNDISLYGCRIVVPVSLQK